MPKIALRPRKPGRPLSDSVDQRSRLLDTALDHVAKQGVASLTLRGVAREAGVTPALLSYYFGNRDQLVATVVEERVLPVFGAALSMMAGAPPANLALGFVEIVNRLVVEHPWLPGLWVREVLVEGGALRELILERIAPRLPQLLAERFADQQRAGGLNADLDPRLLVVSLIGLTLFAHAARPVWSRVFDTRDIGAEQINRHTLALLQRGLELKP